MKKWVRPLCALLAAALVLTCLGACSRSRNDDSEAPEEYSTLTWPTFGPGALLPAPASTKVEIERDRASEFKATVADTPKDAFDAYVQACMTAGFNVDYKKRDESFSAKNADGYEVTVRYKEFVMSVRVKAPDEESEESEESIVSEKPASSAAAESKQQSAGGLRSDFKAAMDSYEAFMDEYVTFMKKYKANPSDMSLLSSYTSYMSKYADFVNKFGKWESEDLNDEEARYYLEVQTRVSKKLLDAGVNG